MNFKFQISNLRFLFLLLFASTISAQNIELKSGQVVETTGVHRSGDNVMGKITVGASVGEIGYPIGAIAKINFPEPAALQSARVSCSPRDSRKRR
jgi:hypothetical protein